MTVLDRARWQLLGGLLLVIVALLLTGMLLVPATAPAGTHVLSSALRSPGAWQPEKASHPMPGPAGGASALAVTLPDVWRRQTPRLSGLHHYIFTLPPPSWDGPSALYLPRLGNRARLWLDGEQLAVFGDLQTGQQDYSSRPLLVNVPRPREPGQPAQLVIELAGMDNRFSGMAPPWWGPAQRLEPAFLERDTLLLAGGGLAAGGSLLLGGLGLAMAAWRRNRMLLFFGLAGLAAGTRALLWMWREPPLPYAAWYTALDGCFGIWACCICWFALRAAEIRVPLLEWSLRGLMAVMLPASALAAAGGGAWLKETWLDLTLVVAGVITLLLLRRAWRRPDAVGCALALGAVTVLTLSGLDHWNIFFSREADAYLRPYFSHHMALLFGVFMATVLAARLESAEGTERRLRDNLANLVQAQREELQTLHDRERQALEVQVRQRERQRFLQDMHDGLGSHLSSMLSMVQRGRLSGAELEREVAEAIDHLRLTVDSASLEEATLTDVVAQVRYRLAPRLEKAGVSVQWRLEETPGDLSPEQASHVQRLVLEALSNALRHAEATQIQVHTGMREGARFLSVKDNGRGLPAANQGHAPPKGPAGLGIRGMHSRALALDATLRLGTPAHGGTCVLLTWPKPLDSPPV